MNSHFLYSSRLLFIAGSPTLLEAELVSTQQLAQVLNVAIPSDWPPGEYDQGAMQFFLDQLVAGGPKAIGWYGWYVILYPTSTIGATLVASGGFLAHQIRRGWLKLVIPFLMSGDARGLLLNWLKCLLTMPGNNRALSGSLLIRYLITRPRLAC